MNAPAEPSYRARAFNTLDYRQKWDKSNLNLQIHYISSISVIVMMNLIHLTFGISKIKRYSFALNELFD